MPLQRTVLRRSLLVATSLCVAAKLSAQLGTVPRGITEARIVAAAEAEGSAFQHLKISDDNATPRKCVVGADTGPVRSGEFTIGGNLGGYVAMRAGHAGKVWWAPLHSAADMPPLVVRGRNATTPRDTVTYTTSSIARPMGPAEQKYFFPSGIMLPTPGRWILIATSGANWGCFILAAY